MPVGCPSRPVTLRTVPVIGAAQGRPCAQLLGELQFVLRGFDRSAGQCFRQLRLGGLDLGLGRFFSLFVGRRGFGANRLGRLQFGLGLGREQFGLVVIFIGDFHPAGPEFVETLNARPGRCRAELEVFDLRIHGGEVARFVRLSLGQFGLGGEDLLVAGALGRVACRGRLGQLRPRDLHLLQPILGTIEFGDGVPFLEDGPRPNREELRDAVARRPVNRYHAASGLKPTEGRDPVGLGGSLFGGRGGRCARPACDDVPARSTGRERAATTASAVSQPRPVRLECVDGISTPHDRTTPLATSPHHSILHATCKA